MTPRLICSVVSIDNWLATPHGLIQALRMLLQRCSMTFSTRTSSVLSPMELAEVKLPCMDYFAGSSTGAAA